MCNEQQNDNMVPYIVYEELAARADRRFRWVCAALVISNALWACVVLGLLP